MAQRSADKDDDERFHSRILFVCFFSSHLYLLFLSVLYQNIEISHFLVSPVASFFRLRLYQIAYSDTSFYILVIEMTHTLTHTNANTKPFRNALTMQLFSMFPYIRFWNGILVLVHCTGSHIHIHTYHFSYSLFRLIISSHFIQLNLRRE